MDDSLPSAPASGTSPVTVPSSELSAWAAAGASPTVESPPPAPSRTEPPSPRSSDSDGGGDGDEHAAARSEMPRAAIGADRSSTRRMRTFRRSSKGPRVVPMRRHNSRPGSVGVRLWPRTACASAYSESLNDAATSTQETTSWAARLPLRACRKYGVFRETALRAPKNEWSTSR
jgi:hypothetical protein